MESWKGNGAKGKVVCSVLHSRIGKRIHSLTTECAVLLYHLSKFPPCLWWDIMDHSKQKQFLAIDSCWSSLLPLYHWQHVFSTCLIRLVRMKIQNDQMIKKRSNKINSFQLYGNPSFEITIYLLWVFSSRELKTPTGCNSVCVRDTEGQHKTLLKLVTLIWQYQVRLRDSFGYQ